MSIFLITSTILFLSGLLIIYWLHNQYHLDIVVQPVSPPHNAPLMSICVPARNEEKNIRACAEAILSQTYPNFEVDVLDARSTGSRVEILHIVAVQNYNLNVIIGWDVPSGCAGK